ncbi:MAG: TIGR01458 family HAD-type hydrolase [Acidobacteriaceae bacterium]|nr:TIGR01458 family HAD-type hydrolase [Acidobacteriaceae bacterium]
MRKEALRGILFDLDGVLYNAGRLIDGAVEAVQWVHENRIPYLFVTNTTSRSRAALVEKLRSFGFSISESQILTPAVAAAEWLRTHHAGQIALFVRESTRLEFADLPCLPDQEEQGASCVIVGDLGEQWDYQTLNRAFRLLHHNPEALLVALGMTRYWMAAEGISLDVGPFVAALEYAAGRKAIVFGKPAAPFFRAGVERLAFPPAQVLMIGDDLETDIGGAQAAGLKGALVKTGKFRPADLEGSITPDLILDSVAALQAWWPR